MLLMLLCIARYTPRKFAEEQLGVHAGGGTLERIEEIRATIAWCALAESRKVNDGWSHLQYAAAFRLKEVAGEMKCVPNPPPLTRAYTQLAYPAANILACCLLSTMTPLRRFRVVGARTAC